MSRFHFYKQAEEMDCGPTCLRMIAKYYSKNISSQEIRELTNSTRLGSSLLSISDAAEKIGFRTLAVKISYEKLTADTPLPCIAHWNQNHFVVIYKIRNNKVHIADPGHGLLTYAKEEFLKCWKSSANEGILLLLEPTPEFIIEDDNFLPKSGLSTTGFSFLFKYLFKYKKLIIQLILGLLAGSLLQLIFPFLTQSIIDIGVQNNDIKFIYLILFSQLMLFLGRTLIEIIRSWILMHISSRINISLVSDFFIKLMKLPISFFDTKMTGDIMQRINDHNRIENFLTSTTLNVLFSFVNLMIFCVVLAYYNLTIFLVFMTGSILYFGWISFFMKQRASLDFKRFHQNAKNQSKVMELVSGMQEIKLHNAERQKRWQWEKIQISLFKINIKGLALAQIQNTGATLINELKNIFITFLAAKLVIDGQITLGMMLSISYIIGQLNSPITQLVGFAQSLQDAKLSLERLSEIHNKTNEEPNFNKINSSILSSASINIKNVSFQYTGIPGDVVLKNLNLIIPHNKTTAIVGTSGSGKTTLMKLLLKFYEPLNGEIKVGTQDLNSISAKLWREKCGVVMQEGYIFSDTIANNIAIGEEYVDREKLQHASTVANITEYIEKLPLGYNTKIGMEGIGLSTGQKQRILIARAVYKNPDYLFFDEATSALDANNERIIMNNLNNFFNGKTVVVIAHRLSTVKNADQIIVLDKGNIIELGNHNELAVKKGAYYSLVKNQLELGN
jgi:ATP-binding cassette subfamily B protein